MARISTVSLDERRFYTTVIYFDKPMQLSARRGQRLEHQLQQPSFQR